MSLALFKLLITSPIKTQNVRNFILILKFDWFNILIQKNNELSFINIHIVVTPY